MSLRVGLMKSAALAILGTVLALTSNAQSKQAENDSDADARATRIVDAMTLDEQISLLRPLPATPPLQLAPEKRPPLPAGAIGSAGFLPGIPRLGWPALQESDGPLGVANIFGLIRPGDETTALPSSLAWAANFDPATAESAGRVIGAEAHAKGFNVMLSGGLNLARDPRNGRNFEYAGEDPLLAGTTVGAAVAGIQSQHVVSTVKHFAFNDQESGRGVFDARIDEAAARESDLLAFQIAIEKGQPGSVMCSYNKVNGDHSCENDFLLNRVLKGDWKYPGWVMSDWGGVHSLEGAIRNGLDQHSPQSPKDYFAELKEAVKAGRVSRAKVRDMTFRIVRSVIAVGALDYPAKPGGEIDREAHAAIAQRIAESGAVLLKNEGLLPIAKGKKRIVIVGGHADLGVLTGGGGSQVNPYGGLKYEKDAQGIARLFKPGFDPSSPLKALRSLRPEFDIQYDDGTDTTRAATVARGAEVVIVFALKGSSEAFDSADLTLPDGQDNLIATIAEANPNTAVVLETGNPVVMPWLGSVKAVLEVWFPGQRGGEAVAAILTGEVSPSGRLPITFPKSVDQLPRPKLDGFTGTPKSLSELVAAGTSTSSFSVNYHEGSDVGYRWFEKTSAEPLFPFGHGLTYTTFSYGDLKVTGGRNLTATLKVNNTGKREGVEVAQLYVAPPNRTHRLVGWARVSLNAGESRTVTITADPRLLASYSDLGWHQAAGTYDAWVSPSSKLSGLHGQVQLEAIDSVSIAGNPQNSRGSTAVK